MFENECNPPLAELGVEAGPALCCTLGNIAGLLEYISHYCRAVAGMCESLLFKGRASADLRAPLQTIMELFSFQQWHSVGRVYFPKEATCEELLLEETLLALLLPEFLGGHNCNCVPGEQFYTSM